MGEFLHVHPEILRKGYCNVLSLSRFAGLIATPLTLWGCGYFCKVNSKGNCNFSKVIAVRIGKGCI